MEFQNREHRIEDEGPVDVNEAEVTEETTSEPDKTSEPVQEETFSDPEPEPEQDTDPMVTDSDGNPLTQSQYDAQLRRRLERQERKLERERKKKMEKMFGTSDENEIANYYQAGRAVSERAGAPPRTILDRLRQQQSQQKPGQQQGVPAPSSMSDNEVLREVRELRETLETERERNVRQKQEQEARDEFGNLFEENRMDIEEYAEDYGLSLTDASAVVLRPHLKNHYKNQTKKQQQTKRNRAVDTGSGSPGKSTPTPSESLTASQKRVAQKMGLSPTQYYNQLKELGQIDES